MRARYWVALGILGALLVWRKDDVATAVETVIDKTKELIAGAEGLRLDAYQDAVGKWTIGYGHLIKPGEPYFPYGDVKTIPQDEADRLFEVDTAIARGAVNTYVHVPITENQRAALTSFVFNVGVGAFQTSTLLKKLNGGDTVGAANELDRWVHADGTVLAGLVKRRALEKEIFLA